MKNQPIECTDLPATRPGTTRLRLRGPAQPGWRIPGARTAALLTLLAAATLLQGCGALRGLAGNGSAAEDGEDAEQAAAVQASEAPLSFTVEVRSANSGIASHLEKHMDIQRYTRFPDLRATEFNRLLADADTNARDLLAALGYFNPELTLRVEDAPADSAAPRRIVIEVEPGEQTTVAGHRIGFAEPMNSDPSAARQRQRVERGWSLKDDTPFTQSEWSSAKSAGLRVLQRDRYPTARIADSQATVDADANRATLRVDYDAGPPYRFGTVELQGVKRYDPEGIKNIARIPTGSDYSEEALLDAQQRLASSGYFDAAFLMLDTENSDPDNATVIAQLREAKYQKLVFGVGISTDAGLRLSVDHTHNKMWPLGWRAVNQIALDANTQALSTKWTAMPHASGWAWYTGASIERAEYGDYKANSLSLVGGRTKSVGHIDRSYYLQYDMSKTEGSDAPGSSSSLLANYAWTGRYFNNKTNPTSGYGLGAEVGAGFTLTPQREPFARARLRALRFWPLGQRNEMGRRSRLALRGEAGAIIAKDDVEVPVTLLFLTGGDTTVRGYSYESIGTRSQGGKLYGGRYMTVGSIEWQRPITLFGNATDWEHATFVDVGTVSDETSDVTLYTGVGTGIRWNSPVGPMQADVAYGIKKQQVRLHLRMGFNF
ncbi:outer membrane protein assembly factor [Corticibacter populi]|uniref:Translocation and assembly module subunit TamA n=1 Tax=Corticibacter populi TaxID=1550736 RepID=A0A3M6QPX6_9BURK|nr:BamA/TamA family outer membrane protein [Corticibacter populi]RMX04851.1 outer membrane protein assembly factor [Corticibacter populi]RZS33728.1 autotransporter secretion outer membrane protein TamA [Corticibacter populi]